MSEVPPVEASEDGRKATAFFFAESERAKQEITQGVTNLVVLEEREYPFAINPRNYHMAGRTGRAAYFMDIAKMFEDLAKTILNDVGVVVIHRTLIVLDETDPDRPAKAIRVWFWAKQKP